MKSFPCDECGRGTVRPTYVTERIELSGQMYLVKGVPVGLCPRCGKKYLEPRVIERVKSLAAQSNGPRSILYTNEHAIPGFPDACPEDDREAVLEEEEARE
jgi:YgiT-type zinc finger domain-containing protein